MLEHAADRRFVGVEQQRAEDRVELLLEREIQHEVERVCARRDGELGHRSLLERGARGLDDVHPLPFAVEQPEVRRLRQFRAQRVAESRLAQLGLEALSLQRQRRPPSIQTLEYVGRMQREVHGERAARNRTEQSPAALVCFLDLLQILEYGLGVRAAVKERGNHHRALRLGGELLEEADRRLPAFRQHEYAAPGLAQAADQRAQLGGVGEARGHRPAAFAVVRRGGAGGEADGAGAHALQDESPHLRNLFVRRRAFGGCIAHHVRADRRMADERRHVEGSSPALEHVEVLRHGLEVPPYSGAQHFQRHALDLGEILHHQVTVARAAGRDGEPAVADDRGGDAERGRRRGPRVPRELCIVVSMVVDDPGHEGKAVGHDGFSCMTQDLSHFNDASILHRDPGAARRRAQPVEQQRVPDDQVEHRASVYFAKMFDLKDRTAVVTGGAKGIGAATAKLLREAGARVEVLDLSTGCDVTDEAQVKNAFAGIGGLDILVNNAGRAIRKSAVEVPKEDWDAVIELNLTALFLCSRLAHPYMKKRGGGAIVNLASIMGLSGGIYPNASYQASKGGVVNLTRALALEWAPDNIRVNAVAPTYVRTDLTVPIFSNPDVLKTAMAHTPLGRFPEPEDVAAAILFLASDAARCITGVTLPVDSGYLAR